MPCTHSRTYKKVVGGVSKEFTNTESFLMKNDIMKEVQNRGKRKNINFRCTDLRVFSNIFFKNHLEKKGRREGGGMGEEKNPNNSNLITT